MLKRVSGEDGASEGRPKAAAPAAFQLPLKLPIGVVLLTLALIPFPTRVSPEISVSVVNPDGTPFRNVINVSIGGSSNAGHVDESFAFDHSGSALIPAQRVWSSCAGRLCKRLVALLPHGGGWSDSSWSIRLRIPEESRLSETAGLVCSSRSSSMEVWSDPATGDGYTLQIEEHSKSLYVQMNSDARNRFGGAVRIVLEAGQ